MVAIRQKGAGDPVLLIGGVGADMFLWFRQIPELSKHFQVIAFDTRGAGESGKPDEPYTIEIFAADTAGLLQELDNDLDAGSKPRLFKRFARPLPEKPAWMAILAAQALSPVDMRT